MRENLALTIALISLIFSGLSLYETHFAGPDLSINSLPGYYETIQYNTDNDINFDFQLYNEGGKTAFISYILIYQITDSGDEILYFNGTASPTEFFINPGEIQQIDVTIWTPHAKITDDLKIVIVQENPYKRIESDLISASWY